MNDLELRASKIKLCAFDVDGVLQIRFSSVRGDAFHKISLTVIDSTDDDVRVTHIYR